MIAPKDIDDEQGASARCERDGCSGARLEGTHCIGHATDEELREAVKRWCLGQSLDARNATISNKCLQRLLGVLTSEDTQRQLASRERDRPGTTVYGSVQFDRARFPDTANFRGVNFAGPASFDDATFAGAADFSDTTFRGHADFDAVTFGDGANFARAIFDDHAGFQGATFKRAAEFDGVRFRSYTDFENATFDGDANMRGATFQLARQLGPFVVTKKLILDESLFTERITVAAVAGLVSTRSAIFTDGVRLSLRAAEIWLDCADFGRASTLSHAKSWTVPTGEDWSDCLLEEAGALPRLATLCGAQVAGLSLSGIDLRHCRFFGAHGLHALIVEPSCKWQHTPPSRFCIDREMIAEEYDWRCRDEKSNGVKRTLWRYFSPQWNQHDCERLDRRDSDHDAVLEPEQLAALYRALRKASEDGNDQAGAGDLYYGEMEMRRRIPIPRKRGRIRGHCDWGVISAYWLLAGYGLRASRAFGALITVTLLAAIPLSIWGFHPPRAYGRALLFAVQSGVSLLHPPEAKLSASGQVIEIVLRLASPVFFGLAILSLRSRIKR